MKLKGIGVFEQHLEKGAVALGGLVLLVVFAYQFIGSPNAVQVGQSKVNPDQAADKVREMARAVKGKLETPTEPNIPPQPSILGEVRRALTGDAFEPRPVVLAGAWGATQASINTPPRTGPGAAAGSRFAEFRSPPPSAPCVSINEGTVDPWVPFTSKDVAGFFEQRGQSQPLDLRSVSVQAAISARMLVDGLSRPAETGVTAMPAAWWQGRLEVLDVELRRQARNSDGSWGEEHTVPPVPGVFSLRSVLHSPSTRPADLSAILSDEKSRRESIRRAPYWATISGEPWTPPCRAAESSKRTPADVTRKARELRSKNDELTRIREQLERPTRGPGSPGGPSRPPTPPGGGPGGKPPGGQADAASTQKTHWPRISRDYIAQSGGGLPPGGPPPPQGDDRAAKRKLDLEKRRDALIAEVDKLRADLKQQGYDENGRPLVAEPAEAFAEPLNSLTDATTDTVTLWAHDVTAEPGKTYRYRIVPWFTNPMFGNVAGLDDSQKPLAERAAVAGTPSEWTAPVAISPSIRYVISSAREAGTVGEAGTALLQSEASASGEMYEFYYGFWRRGSLELAPGDRLGSRIDLPELFIYELTATSPGQPEQAGENQRKPLDRQHTLSVDAFLCDVISAGGIGGTGAVQAVVRDAQGNVELLTPGQGLSEPERDHLLRSSEMGKASLPKAPGSGSPAAGGSPPPGNQPPGSPPTPGGPGGPTSGGRPGGKPPGD